MSEITHMTATTGLITVEEAAERLGLSAATVRRRCAAGDLPCQKVGRSWLVEAAALGTRRGRLRRTGSTTSAFVDLPAALGHLLRQDLPKDVWVPDVLFFQDELAARDHLFAMTYDKLDSLVDFDPPMHVSVPKSPLFVRQGIDLSLSDRLAYQAVVREIESYTDPRLSDRAFATRPRDRNQRRHAGGTQPWLNWKRATRDALETCHGWLIKTDMTAYFDFIEHRKLFQLLQEAQVPDALLKPLRAMLRTWSPAKERGLPQGPDASRVLANYYLIEVDDALSGLEGVEYFRYMDDIAIVSASRAKATAALQLLGELCYQAGLPLSTQKTEALSFEDALRDLAGDRFDEFEPGPYDTSDDIIRKSKASRRYLARLFSQSFKRSGQIDSRRAKFSLFRLFKLSDRTVLKVVLENLDNLGPIGRLTPYYLSHWINDPRVAEQVADYLKDPERNTSEYFACLLLTCALEKPQRVDAELLTYARRTFRDRGRVSYLRAAAANVLVLSGRQSDSDAVEQVVLAEYDPVIVRGCVVALYRVGRLHKSIQEKIQRRQGYDALMSYLLGRNNLPSMLFRDRRHKVA
jgi:excisionase family DNA binding protein